MSKLKLQAKLEAEKEWRKEFTTKLVVGYLKGAVSNINRCLKNFGAGKFVYESDLPITNSVGGDSSST